jgi:hypothetical protein
MSLDLDANIDKARAKTITLAGQQFTVCPLPLRQVLAIADQVPKLRGISIDNVSAEKFEPAIAVLLAGLKKAHPGITQDDLLDLPISLVEIMHAVPVIVEQAGGQRADAAPGEPSAASLSSNSTGAGSSPTS